MDSRAGHPADDPGLSLFEAAAEAPDRPALITDGRTFTYRELAHLARPLVRALRALPEVDGAVDAGDRVPPVLGVIATNDPETVVLVHALVALGIPALFLHPGHTPDERQALAEGVGAARVLDASWVAAVWEGDAPGEDGEPPATLDPPVLPADERPLAIVPTSGTSGRPRGVVLSRRAFAASAAASAANLGWEEDDRWLLPLPLAHVGGLSILTRCLLARRTVILAPDTAPEALRSAMERHRATLASLVPTLLARLLEPTPAPPPPPDLRAVLLGGAAASPALLERAADAGWPVLTTYGMTEACSQATTQRYGTVNRGEAGSGPPLPGMEVRIGADDVIELRGPTLFSGYLPAEDDSPFTTHGWFPTGDRGRLDDHANLHVLGRRTDRIITGGENVDPTEVEAALESLPGVRAACVFGVPDPEWGERVAAAVIVEEGGDDGLEDAVRGLAHTLAPFKRPRLLARVDRLPTNATGKVDRAAAADLVGDRLKAL